MFNSPTTHVLFFFVHGLVAIVCLVLRRNSLTSPKLRRPLRSMAATGFRALLTCFAKEFHHCVESDARKGCRASTTWITCHFDMQQLNQFGESAHRFCTRQLVSKTISHRYHQNIADLALSDSLYSITEGKPIPRTENLVMIFVGEPVPWPCKIPKGTRFPLQNMLRI